MPIAVVCPKCGAKISAPDDTVGQRVKCRKFGCGAAITVPKPAQFEVVEDEPPAPQPSAKPKKAVAEVDEEDEPKKRKKAVVELDEEEDDEDEPKKAKKKPARAEVEEEEEAEEEEEKPKKKKRAWADDEDEDDKPTIKKAKRKKKRGGSSPVVLAFVALLVLGFVGFGVYAVIANPFGGSKVPARVPPGWEEYRSDDDKFKMAMPKGVRKDEDHGLRIYYGDAQKDGREVMVVVTDVPRDATPQERKQFEDRIFNGFRGHGRNSKQLSRERVQFAGQTALELVVEENLMDENGATSTLRGVIRIFMTDTRGYMVGIGGKFGPDVRKETKDISDTFQILK